MPCPWTRRCQAANSAEAEAHVALQSASAVEDWKVVRRENLRMMRKQTRAIVLLMALIEAMRVGPVQIVYAGRLGYSPPGEEDYGIAYTAGYVLSYIYVCAFSIIFVPLFSWWVPNKPTDADHPSLTQKIAEYLKTFDMVLLPVTIGFCLAQHIYYTIQTFIYVESRSVGDQKYPKNNRKNWIVRAMLLLGVALSLSFGYGSFQILEQTQLAHVKPLEYAVIVVPIQINIGMLIGSVMQFKMEKRIAAKRIRAEMAKREQASLIDEKQTLLEV